MPLPLASAKIGDRVDGVAFMTWVDRETAGAFIHMSLTTILIICLLKLYAEENQDIHHAADESAINAW